MTTTETPAYLAGHLAPVPDEISAVDLPVEGSLPPELTGRYLRNGPNPLPGEDPGHWFAGHGMVHGVRLRDGRAEWYRNRWVRTGALAGRQFMGPDGVDRSAVTANTHIIEHGGSLLALVENGLPYELTPELETVGPRDFGGRLTTAMTAHPKEDPRTGALHFFAYSPIAPHLVYHRLSATNELECSAEVPGAGPSMMHDFAVTDRHALFLDLPMVFKMDQVGQSGLPFGWDADYPARIGVMPLDRPGEVTWIGIDPCYVFHVGGAHTDGAGRIVLDACRYDSAGIDRLWGTIGGGAAGPAADAASTGRATLHRWTIDPVAGTVAETALDDRPAEFPTFDDRRMGQSARYLYTVSERGRSAALVKHDHATGTATTHELGPDTVTGEAVFVPAADGTAEDDGWLIGITTRRDGSASQLVVLDATDVAAAPVAAVDLPRGVPAGFHGSWVPDA